MDGSVLFPDVTGTKGGVVRDSNGLALCCFNEKLGFSSPLFVELKAIWNGIHLAKENNWKDICVESDSQLAVDVCTSQRHWSRKFQGLIFDIKSLITDLNDSIIFVSYNCNTMVHWLACNGLP